METERYFAAVTSALENAGRFRPSIVIDRERLDANMALVKSRIAQGQVVRLVDKSLAALPLIARLLAGLGTNKIMTFHLPLTREVLKAFPDADLLYGKPMPEGALMHFFSTADVRERQDFAKRVVLLADDAARLRCYARIAAATGLDLRYAIEIDTGMHRGGFDDPRTLAEALAGVSGNSRLKCEGLMGYEAHIVKIPGLFGGAAGEKAKVIARYKAFADVLKPGERSLLNIGGSNTVLGYGQASPGNEFSMGSAFLLPTDFDGGELSDLKPAFFIATPILKSGPARLPGPSFMTSLLQTIGVFPRQGCFLYGGKWMAKPVHPKGMKENKLWGTSSNQQFMALPQPLDPENHGFAFLRPTQSEAILQQFGPIAVYEGGKIIEEWQPIAPC
jgi:D-serine deaminase-like pyridoxal phosphate-dependent protein